MTVLTGATTAALLERDSELAALDDVRAAVTRARQGRVVFLAGEAGIGKTALMRRFCERSGTRVLWAACDPLFTPRPLGPLLDLARDVGRGLQEQLEAGAPPQDVAGAVLDELDRGRPTIVVLEDLHWADEATLDVARVLARRIDRVPAMLVASYREEQVHSTHPLRLLLGEVRDAVRIELKGLTPAAVAVLAGPASLDPGELHRRTSGNPFYVTEAIAVGGHDVPATVRDAVLARAARLSPPARELLAAVAIVPRAVEVWLLEALVPLPSGALRECLDSGTLATEGDAVAFRHEIARLAVEESLAPDRRVALHRLALAALADPPSGTRDRARLAHHAEAAADGPAVLRHAPVAAEHAARVGAHREAQAQYGRALRFAGGLSPEARAELLMAFAREGYLTDMRPEAVTAVSSAIDIYHTLDAPERLADALRLRARLDGCGGWGGRPLVDVEEAIRVLEALPPGKELARSYALLAGAYMNLDRAGPALTWSARALELGDRLDDPETMVRGLNYAGAMRLARGEDAGLEQLLRSIALAIEHGRDTDVGLGYINLGGALGRRRAWRIADPHIAEGIAFCRERGLEAWAACVEGWRGWSLLAQGRWSEAADAAWPLLEYTLPGVPDARFCALVTLGSVRARRGDPGVKPMLDEALALARDIDQLQFTVPVVLAGAEAAWLKGSVDQVEGDTRVALEEASAAEDWWMTGELALWRRRAGVVEPMPTAEGPWALALAGDHRRAATALRDLGCDYDAALALADSPREADLREALAVLQELGARPAAQIVSRRLREGGFLNVPRGPRATTKVNPAGLTARELEVLALIGEGLRNAEIAQRLVLSEKTVGHHVSSVLRKLGVSSRGQAAARAARDGLLI